MIDKVLFSKSRVVQASASGQSGVMVTRLKPQAECHLLVDWLTTHDNTGEMVFLAVPLVGLSLCFPLLLFFFYLYFGIHNFVKKHRRMGIIMGVYIRWSVCFFPVPIQNERGCPHIPKGEMHI